MSQKKAKQRRREMKASGILPKHERNLLEQEAKAEQLRARQQAWTDLPEEEKERIRRERSRHAQGVLEIMSVIAGHWGGPMMVSDGSIPEGRPDDHHAA